MKRITEKQLEKQARTVSAGLSDADLKLWVAVLEGEAGQKICVVWMKPRFQGGEKEKLFEGTLKEAWVFLEGFRLLRPKYKAGLFRKVAKSFGVRV